MFSEYWQSWGFLSPAQGVSCRNNRQINHGSRVSSSSFGERQKREFEKAPGRTMGAALRRPIPFLSRQAEGQTWTPGDSCRSWPTDPKLRSRFCLRSRRGSGDQPGKQRQHQSMSIILHSVHSLNISRNMLVGALLSRGWLKQSICGVKINS